MRGPALLVVVVACAAPAAAQVAPSRPTTLDVQRQIGVDAARVQQQSLSTSLQIQELNVAQARLQVQQSLQALEAARPAPPTVPADYPASSGIRRAGERSVVPPTPSAPVAADPGAATRGDLPL